jgi:hypothetical protein
MKPDEDGPDGKLANGLRQAPEGSALRDTRSAQDLRSLLEKNPSSNPSVTLRFPIRKDAVTLELALQLGHLPILQQSSL